MFGTSCTCKKWLPPPDILLHRLKTICTPGRCKTKNVCHHSNPPAAPVHRIKNGCQPLHIQNKMVATPPTQAKCLVHPAVTVHKLNDCHTLHRLPPVHAKRENNVAAPLPTPTPPPLHRVKNGCHTPTVHKINNVSCILYMQQMVAIPHATLLAQATKWLPALVHPKQNGCPRPPPCTA